MPNAVTNAEIEIEGFKLIRLDGLHIKSEEVCVHTFALT